MKQKIKWIKNKCPNVKIIKAYNYILTVVPPDEVMFDPKLWIGAFIIPFTTITVVTFVLKFYVNNKLKNVDMLEALKSVD